MNSVQLVGRLTREADTRYTDGGSTVCRFTIACDRRFKKDGEQSADFISCVAFGKTAEFVGKYFRQGYRIGLNGRIQTGSYINKDNVKVYTVDVIVDNAEFTESKGSGGAASQNTPTSGQMIDSDGFMHIPDDIDEDLPFN